MADPQITQPPFPGWRLAKPGEQPAQGEQDLVHEATGKRFIGPSTTWPTEQERTTSQRVGAYLLETAKRGAIPTALGTLGGAVGGPAGGALGAVGGVMLNQGLGIEPASQQPWVDYPTAAIGGALPGIAGNIAKNMPGVEPGLQRASFKQAGRIVEKTRPSVPGSELMQQLPHDVVVGVRNLTQAAAGVSENLGATAPLGRAAAGQKPFAIVQQVLDAFANSGIPPKVFDRTQRLMGTYARAAKSPETRNVAGQLRDALLADLEEGAAKVGSKQAALYRQAADAYKQELFANRLDSYLNPYRKGSKTGLSTGYQQTNYGAIADNVMKDAELMRWGGKDQVDQVAAAFAALQRNTPRIPAALGQGITGQTFAQRRLEGTPLATMLGALTGYQHGGVLGGALGGMIPVLATEGISRLIARPAGQAIVMALASKGTPSAEIVKVLAQLAGQGLAQTGAAALRPGTPTAPAQ